MATLKRIAVALGASLEVRFVEEHRRRATVERTEDELVQLLRGSFWEKRLERSDLEEYPEWILSRILMFGTTEQVSAVRCFFGDDAIRGVMKSRGIDARTRNYWDLILG